MTKEDLLEGLRNCAAFLAIFLAFTLNKPLITIPLTTVAVGLFAYFVGVHKGTTKKERIKTVVAWSGMTLVFGLLAAWITA